MLVLNFYGGPGVGKSTYAAYFYSKLKMRGVNCELVTEYAKQKFWENNDNILSNQVYIFAKQYVGLTRLNGKIELAIMDSPLLLSLLYQSNPKIKNSFSCLVFDCYKEFDNLNYFICMDNDVTYVNHGRYQSEDNARKLNVIMKQILDKNLVSYKEINRDNNGQDNCIIDAQIDLIYSLILNRRGQIYDN